MVLAKRIVEGGEFPTGYGFAYRDWARNQAVCYPVGLNWAAAFAFYAWNWLRHGVRHEPTPSEMDLLRANLAGQAHGVEIGMERRQASVHAEGYAEGWNAAFARIDSYITDRVGAH